MNRFQLNKEKKGFYFIVRVNFVLGIGLCALEMGPPKVSMSTGMMIRPQDTDMI